ncbi:MAG: hypothetical protein ACREB8_16775 [Pseudolabrys sp.]
MADLHGWELDKDRNIIVFPLTGYSTQIGMGTAVMLQLQYGKPGDSREKPSGRLPLVLTPAQANELAQAIQRAASKIDQSSPPSSVPRS